MALNTIDDVIKIEKLLELKDEYKNENTLKSEIITEGVQKRLNESLGLQTTLLGRIEINDTEFTEVYLREFDAPEVIKEKYSFDKEKKIYTIPLKEFLKELKLSIKNQIQKKIDDLQTELDKISKCM